MHKSEKIFIYMLFFIVLSANIDAPAQSRSLNQR
jgi:hypothetical protein